MAQELGLTEVEAFNRATLAVSAKQCETAHDENVAAWTQAIEYWMNEQSIRKVSLLQLQQSIDLPLIPLWLALLSGSYRVEQRGEFYEQEQIWVQTS